MNIAEQIIVGQIDIEERKALVSSVRSILRAAPLIVPCLPGMTVRYTNAGKVGWHWTEHGPRYLDRHPVTGRPWSPIPVLLLDIFRRYRLQDRDPDCAHVVWYRPGAKLGAHQDTTEADKDGEVIGVSEGRGRLRAGLSRSELDQADLPSGSVTRLSGPTRMLYHAVDGIEAQQGLFSDSFLDAAGRVSVTMRSGAAA